jgi:4-hydroxy-3-methylbut-2-enyl diphosphate reductase
MEVIVAKSAGFCFGVKRAVDTVYEQVEKATGDDNGKIYTYGPIIHNEQVVEELQKHGVEVLEEDKLGEVKKGTIIIRSHGVEKKIYDQIEAQKLTCVDATCPFVKRIHKVVEKESAEGKQIIIVGNAGHPEVVGIEGWCHNKAVVIGTVEEATNYQGSKETELCVVSQTTFRMNKFQEIVDIFATKGYNVNVVNTICNATEERQTEAKAIAQKADVMIVIGGAHSSNSRKLYEICKSECEQTYFIQTLDDLHLELPKSVRLVGITAGASTPNNIIEEVQSYVRRNF